jgi:hypothetical protein
MMERLNFLLRSLLHMFGTKLVAQEEDIGISTIYSKVDAHRLKGAIDRLGNNLVTDLPKSSKIASERSN